MSTGRTKDSTQECEEKEPMSPAKIKQHESTSVRRDPNDQKSWREGKLAQVKKRKRQQK